jgi:hypothetical protein
VIHHRSQREFRVLDDGGRRIRLIDGQADFDFQVQAAAANRGRNIRQPPRNYRRDGGDTQHQPAGYSQRPQESRHGFHRYKPANHPADDQPGHPAKYGNRHHHVAGRSFESGDAIPLAISSAVKAGDNEAEGSGQQPN